MSEYLDRLKRLSKNGKLVYANEAWLKAIDRMFELEGALNEAADIILNDALWHDQEGDKDADRFHKIAKGDLENKPEYNNTPLLKIKIPE